MTDTLSEPRRIFPALLNVNEREMLAQLSAESRLSMSGVVRVLILKETASRQLMHQEPRGKALARSNG